MKKQRIVRCKYCGSEYNQKRGLHNWKNLFRKPTIDDWITLFIIIMVLFSVYAYKADIKVCREYIKQQEIDFKNMTFENTEEGYNEKIGFDKETIDKFIPNKNKTEE